MKYLSILFFFLGALFNQFLFGAPELTPYFQYQKPNLEYLRHLRTDRTFTIKDLRFWDKELIERAVSSSLEDGDRLRMTTYLFEGQRDFAALAMEYKGALAGSIDLLSSQILRLFCPEYSSPAATRIYDPFTLALTNIVLLKLAERMIEENRSLRIVKLQKGEDFWGGKKPYFGERVPSFKPWHLEAANQFRAPILPLDDEAFWKHQVAELKKQMEEVDGEKKEAVYYWANMRGQGSGDWLAIASDYTDARPVQKEKLIQFRADFAAALLDAFIAAYDSKYTHLVRRPSVMDPSIQPLISVPNHPSYPSAHSTVGGAAVEILSYYFPENEYLWRKTAKECGVSRIWGGIHFPVDHEEGEKIGKSVANTILKQHQR